MGARRIFHGGRRFLVAMSLLLAFNAAAFAYVRSSASYRMLTDRVTSGGQAASSASYRSPVNALGQIAGRSQSASYSMVAGIVVLPIGQTAHGISQWFVY